MQKHDSHPRRPWATCGLALAAWLAFAGHAKAAGPVYEYVDAGSYLRNEATVQVWYGLRQRLREEFDQICGDTFCEGEYSNIESLGFLCSANRVNGLIGQCVWVFAGSQEDIDPANGRVQVQARSWQCSIPLAPRTTMEALLSIAGADSALHAPLPGTQASIYDGLIACL
ncbi:hypothetical protein [Lysobacter sp. cf310]|uniref:hypothetical protein n=1 Tax=Lysobacter sp. cf310 TaxID=1761790 RepID=UPI0008F21D52|nr:hypothetical protein [Lysobacter sp. cf310]SFK32350.1 hypothetical protein SAMN04487938_0328 [Lysobacter sp. cf310]